MIYLTDKEIDDLILEPKHIEATFSELMRFKVSDGNKRTSHEIARADGSCFIIKLRQNENDIFDFSAILCFREKDKNVEFRLRRYNGKSHPHTNKIERNRILYDFHIHYATERYQQNGYREDAFAEKSDRYSDLNTALQCLINDCNIAHKQEPQVELFD